MGEFNSYCIYYCGQKSFRRNGVALIINKKVQNQYLDTISVCFQGKPFSITVIQVYVPTTDAEAEVDQLYEDLQDLLELTPKKDVFTSQGTEMQK